MPTAEPVTSPDNPLLKDVRKALARGGLTAAGCCVAETFHLLEEALRSHCRIQAVIASESARVRAGRAGIRLIVVPDKLLDTIANVETSQGVIALVEPPEHTLAQIFTPQSLVLVIDGLQDPGNLGAILRSAEAFGATGILILKGSVSPFNPKVLRASAGSIFRVPFVQALDENAALDALQKSGVDLYAAVPNPVGRTPSSASDPQVANLTRPCAIIIGAEAQGVSPTMRSAAQDISIPTAGVESLNAAISAAILLYEARRQRNLRS